MLFMGINLQLAGSSEDLIHSVVITVNSVAAKVSKRLDLNMN